MKGYQFDDFDRFEFSIALTSELEQQLDGHLRNDDFQEDLTFAYWMPSIGAERYTAIINRVQLPSPDERILNGNVAFTADYVARVLDKLPSGSGIAFIHSHLGPGWQGMSNDDVIAERDRLAGLIASATELPLVGMTWSTDLTWSGRFWLRAGRNNYQRRWAETVRSAGSQLRLSYHPKLRPMPESGEAQVATRSVWGNKAQSDLARVHVGIIGLGSVGSIVAETLSRTGIERITLIDPDHIEERNLDRTLGATNADAVQKQRKVEVSRRLIQQSHTAIKFRVSTVAESLMSPDGIDEALDCDVLICCVDRPWPRHVLNTIAYAHLIPVIDGGILARVTEEGTLLHVDWRVHTVGPGHACLYCIDALRHTDAALDRDGLRNNSDYIAGLSHAEREQYERRNIFAFSLSVASHEILQLAGLVTGNQRVGGIGPQSYHAYPGVMEVSEKVSCNAGCDVALVTALAVKLPIDPESN